MKQDFLNAMSRVTQSVTIVTTRNGAHRTGATVSAMTSVSADGAAPLILICLRETSNTATEILKSDAFCVNVLHDQHSALANSFAGRDNGEENDRFQHGIWVETSKGGWRLDDCVVAFDCTLQSHTLQGSHHVMIGAVQEIYLNPFMQSTLLYSNREYATAQPIQKDAINKTKQPLKIAQS